MKLLNLGRYGDIINLLPLLWGEERAGRRSTILVSSEFAGLFDGIAYCDHIEWSGNCATLPSATAKARSMWNDVVVGQVFMNPDQRKLTPSFALESYRLIGRLHEWGVWPTVIPHGNPQTNLEPGGCLVALDGISSPFGRKAEVLEALNKLPIPVHDIGHIREKRVQDLISLMNQAKCIVSCDTVHLWLARAARVPVVALCNDGWKGSPKPPSCVLKQRYSEVVPGLVADAVRKVLAPPKRTILVVDDWGDEPRHNKSRKTWKSCDIVIAKKEWGRTLGKRNLPFWKDMMRTGLNVANDGDIIVWTNSDVQLKNVKKIADHAAIYGAVGVRRDKDHMGRELFAFSAEWLRNNLDAMPDGVKGGPEMDLKAAQYIRATKGIKTVHENLAMDLFPAEIENDGILFHEDHESAWIADGDDEVAKHNRSLPDEKLHI